MNEFKILKIQKYRRKMRRLNIRNLDMINNPQMHHSCSGARYIDELEDEFKKYKELEYDYKYYIDLYEKATEVMELEHKKRADQQKSNLYRRVEELEKELIDIKKRL
ncbi:hypothetical protein UT300012_32810 [Paraclostridium bifermentans]